MKCREATANRATSPVHTDFWSEPVRDGNSLEVQWVNSRLSNWRGRQIASLVALHFHRFKGAPACGKELQDGFILAGAPDDDRSVGRPLASAAASEGRCLRNWKIVACWRRISRRSAL